MAAVVPPSPDLISFVHNDHLMIKHVFPHLEPNDLFSLEKSSQTIEAVYVQKSYWKVFIEYLLQQKKYDRVFQQYTEASPEYSREILEHSNDPDFFRVFGHRLSNDLRNWKAGFDNPRKQTYRINDLIPKLERNEPSNDWSTAVDDSCRYLVGLQRILILPREQRTEKPVLDFDKQVFVWKIDENFLLLNSFSTSTEISYTYNGEPSLNISGDNLIISFYNTWEIWRWMEGQLCWTSRWMDIRQIMVKDFIIAGVTTNCWEVGVYKANETWENIGLTFKVSAEAPVKKIDFDEEFLVTMCRKKKEIKVDGERKYSACQTLKVWSMVDGALLHKFGNQNISLEISLLTPPNFVLFDKKVLFRECLQEIQRNQLKQPDQKCIFDLRTEEKLLLDNQNVEELHPFEGVIVSKEGKLVEYGYRRMDWERFGWGGADKKSLLNEDGDSQSNNQILRISQLSPLNFENSNQKLVTLFTDQVEQSHFKPLHYIPHTPRHSYYIRRVKCYYNDFRMLLCSDDRIKVYWFWKDEKEKEDQDKDILEERFLDWRRVKGKDEEDADGEEDADADGSNEDGVEEEDEENWQYFGII